MDAIYDVYIRVSSFCVILITYELSHMFINCWDYDLNWYDTIMSRWNFNGQLNDTYCCLLFTVPDICEEFSISLYVAVFSLSQAYDIENFFWTSIPKIISVSSNLLQMMKLWVNLKSAILRCSTVIPNVVIGEPSAVFNWVFVGCIWVLKLLSTNWYVECLISEIAAPESMRAL